jgi:hypothetical protein
MSIDTAPSADVIELIDGVAFADDGDACIFVHPCGIEEGEPLQVGVGEGYFTIEQGGVEKARRTFVDGTVEALRDAPVIKILEVNVVNPDDIDSDELIIHTQITLIDKA